MDNYFYIILGIAWVVYSIYKWNAKQNASKNQQANPAKQNSSKSLLEELLAGEQFQTSTVATNQDDHPYINNEQDEQEYHLADETNNVNIAAFEESNINENNSTQDIEIAEENIEIISNDLNDFDLRKAIIYSEILKRPYS